MLGFLRVLFTPACWVAHKKYSADWDMELNVLLANYKFKYTDEFTASLGGTEIWISNHPYASFSKWERDVDTNSKPRPKRITMLRAMDKLTADLAEEEYEISRKSR